MFCGRVMAGTKVPSLYDWFGGVAKIKEVFKKFYDYVRDDATLGPVFAHMPLEHFQTVAHFVSEVLGGPKLYSGDANHSHATMVAKHLGRHLTEQQRKRWVTLLLDTADELGMPQDPE